MLPEHLIYDELKRQRSEWQPEALELPLYIPDYEPRREREHESEEETESERGVIIIDMS
ncbi:MAG: hypothetical protein H0U74_23615 [Bradymonadaceae bacterium]|nr:hypothetical protein [Lujinxingiaceae bacterium]